MRIVILGCGRLGSKLAKNFSEEGHELTIIDRDDSAFKRLGSGFKGSLIHGNIFAEDILQRGLKKGADLFIAVTDKDNMNIMLAQLVKRRFNINLTMARIFDSTLAGVYRELGIETICPTDLALDWIRKKVEEG